MSAAPEATKVDVVNVVLNGREVQGRPGQTILDVAREVGVDIPTLCHDPRLEPYGACRLCLVEVEGARGPMAACGAKITEGMKIQTHTDKIVKLRKFVLELLLTNHPLDCPVCEAAGDCRLQDYAYEYVIDMTPWGWRAPEVTDPGTHPNVAHYGARCILCGRCVRICREVMSIGCWGFLNRGYDSEVDTPYRQPLRDVGCVSCGQCISTCPVGAITTHRAQSGARVWQTDKTRTVCSYCSNGCEFVVHSYKNRVVRIASDVDRGLNGGNLCVRGRFGQGYTTASDRLLKPLVRNAAGVLEESSWDQALARIVAEARNVQPKGAEAFAAVAGAHLTNEAAYLMNKLTRTVFASNNIDSSDLFKRRATDKALVAALGASAATNTRKDLAAADVILVIGSDITESNPVLALTVVKAARQGKTVIVIDPRRTDLARKAKIHLAVKPGSDLAVLRALMAQIVTLGLEDKDFVNSRTEGFKGFAAALKKVDVAAEAALAGVDAELLRAAAEAFGRADAAAVLFGSGVIEGPAAADVTAAIADLALLTGNVGRPGSGLYPLYYTANAQGLSDMGVRPDAGDGAPGKSLGAILDGIDDGIVSFLYVAGDDVALAVADEVRTRESLSKVPFLVVQDSFLTDTATYAHVVLPAALPTEVDGTYTNGERYVQCVKAATVPCRESVPDWEIFQEIARRLGVDWSYQSPADIMREISETVPGYAGISYDRLDDQGIFQPCTGPQDSGTEILLPSAGKGDKAVFAPLSMDTTGQAADAERPFVLITGSVREHHGTGVRSRRSEGLTRLCPDARAQVNSTDAQRLGLAEGDRASVSVDEEHEVTLPVCVTAHVPEGVVFVPGFSPVAPVTRLLSRDATDVTRVKVEPTKK
ncbi:MAG: molybdopterin-dependent oxidoreductase [Thermoleophilia bacterium]|jgi:formate dehydrogenase alpha subunit